LKEPTNRSPPICNTHERSSLTNIFFCEHHMCAILTIICVATPHRWRTTRHYSAARRWNIQTPSTSCATSTRTTRQNYLRESTNLSPLFTPRRFYPSFFFFNIWVLFCVWSPRPLAQRARAPQGRTIYATPPTRVLSSHRAGFFSFCLFFNCGTFLCVELSTRIYQLESSLHTAQVFFTLFIF